MERRVSRQRTRPLNAPLRRVRVLVVGMADDDVDEVASTLLRAGAETVACGVVTDALRMLAGVRIDVVLTATDVRDGEGRDVATLSRSVEGPGLPPPVIGVQRRGRRADVRNAGYDCVLDQSALSSTIVRVVSKLVRAGVH